MLFTLSLQMICNLCIKIKVDGAWFSSGTQFVLRWCTSADLQGVTLICTGIPRRRISLMLWEYILKCFSLSVLFKAVGNCLDIKFFICHCLSRTGKKSWVWGQSFILNSLKSVSLEKQMGKMYLTLFHSLGSHAIYLKQTKKWKLPSVDQAPSFHQP